MTYLFVGGKDGKAGTSGLVLVRGTKGPKGDGTSTELSEPAFQLRLRGVVGKAAHVQDFASLRQEGTHVGAGIHWLGEHVGVILGGCRLADQTSENAGQSDGLFHSTPRRGGSKSLQVEGQVVFDGCRRLDGLDLESSTDVRQGTGAKGKRLWVVGLPTLVFRPQIEGARVLQVRGKHDCLVAGLTGKLHTQIPGIESHKGKVQVFRDQVLLGKGIEAIDGITEGAGISHLVPCESGQARCKRAQSATVRVRPDGRGVQVSRREGKERGEREGTYCTER